MAIRRLSTNGMAPSRALLLGALSWIAVVLTMAFPLGRAICSAQIDSATWGGGYFACQHGAGRLWQALFFAAVAFLVVAALTTLWLTRKGDTAEVDGIVQRLLTWGFSIGIVPPAAILAVSLLYGALWPSNQTLLLVALAWPAIVLATAGGLRHAPPAIRAATLLVVNLLFVALDRQFLALRLAEWMMVMTLTFPVTALALIVRSHLPSRRAIPIPA